MRYPCQALWVSDMPLTDSLLMDVEINRHLDSGASKKESMQRYLEDVACEQCCISCYMYYFRRWLPKWPECTRLHRVCFLKWFHPLQFHRMTGFTSWGRRGLLTMQCVRTASARLSHADVWWRKTSWRRSAWPSVMKHSDCHETIHLRTICCDRTCRSN